ncbi:MAG: hypothetical protein ABI377_01010 [Devosia sp.]
MKAIEIWDLRGQVFMTLGDILAPLPQRVLRSAWTVSDYVTPKNGEEYFEVHSTGDDRISRVANTEERLSGDALASIAKAAPGVVWATFRAYDPSDAPIPWIVLHAIDSTFWRCETRDIPSRQALMKSFKDVRLET